MSRLFWWCWERRRLYVVQTYPLGLLALLTPINVSNVKWFVRIRRVILLLFITHFVSHESEAFLFNLEKLINQIKQLKPSFTIILGDSNAKSSDWFLDDITSPEGTHNFLISMCGFDQLISDRTHYYLLHRPVLTLFLLINLIQWLIVVFTPFMPIATTKLHNVILILWLSIPLLMNVKYGTTKEPIKVV